ncbi:MAG: hypothetical protein JXB49_01815 [Bacteroidales bacterium]|nr:hypothetical protein [Bacteroidales bacterium]
MKIVVGVLLLTININIVKAQTDANWKFDTIEAPSLEGNLLEDEASRLVEVYLPASYYKSDKRYPVVYCLSGYNSRNRKPDYKVKPHKQLMDEKIENNMLNEMIVVFISGSNRLRGSFYVNSPVTGNWADFITKDVVDYIDHNYRTLVTKESRSIIGSSMGGYGALNLSMLYPDVFCAGYGISPGLYTDKGFENSQILNSEGNIKSTLEVIEMFSTLTKIEAHKAFQAFLDTCTNRTLFFTMAYGAAHAPNINKAPYFYFPIKIVGNDTIIDEEIWSLWQNGFGGIEQEIERYRSNLEQLKVYGIACGYNDGHKWLYNGCVYYADKLKENHISHDFYLHQGTHTSNTIDVMINHVLPILSNVMQN